MPSFATLIAFTTTVSLSAFSTVSAAVSESLEWTLGAWKIGGSDAVLSVTDSEQGIQAHWITAKTGDPLRILPTADDKRRLALWDQYRGRALYLLREGDTILCCSWIATEVPQVLEVTSLENPPVLPTEVSEPVHASVRASIAGVWHPTSDAPPGWISPLVLTYSENSWSASWETDSDNRALEVLGASGTGLMLWRRHEEQAFIGCSLDEVNLDKLYYRYFETREVRDAELMR